jgi:adenine-specific DNA-methyltransferase
MKPWALGHSTPPPAKPSSPQQTDSDNWFLGESAGYFVWLVYKPDLNFLKSREAALTLNLAEAIAKMKTGKRHLVFAPAKFVPNKTLLPMGVEYAPLPFALYRVEKGVSDGVQGLSAASLGHAGRLSG